MKNNFSDFFRDDKGNLSSDRLMFVFLTIVVVIAWIILSLRKGSLLEMPMSVIWLIVVLMAAKVIKENGEQLISIFKK